MPYILLLCVLLLPLGVNAKPTLDRECYNYCISRGSGHSVCMDSCSDLSDYEEDEEGDDEGYRRGDIDFECVKECKEHEFSLSECKELCRNPNGW